MMILKGDKRVCRGDRVCTDMQGYDIYVCMYLRVGWLSGR